MKSRKESPKSLGAHIKIAKPDCSDEEALYGGACGGGTRVDTMMWEQIKKKMSVTRATVAEGSAHATRQPDT